MERDASVTRRASRRAPRDFAVTPEMRLWAEAEVPGIDIDRATAAFMDHEYKDPKTDWIGTWRNWIRNSPKYSNAGTVRFKSAGSSIQEQSAQQTAKIAKLFGEES